MFLSSISNTHVHLRSPVITAIVVLQLISNKIFQYYGQYEHTNTNTYVGQIVHNKSSNGKKINYVAIYIYKIHILYSID